MKVEMQGANLLVQPLEEQSGEIIKFNKEEQEVVKAVIKEVNPLTNRFKIGQTIMFPAYAGYKLNEGKTKLRIIKEEDVTLILL